MNKYFWDCVRYADSHSLCMDIYICTRRAVDEMKVHFDWYAADRITDAYQYLIYCFNWFEMMSKSWLQSLESHWWFSAWKPDASLTLFTPLTLFIFSSTLEMPFYFIGSGCLVVVCCWFYSNFRSLFSVASILKMLHKLKFICAGVCVCLQNVYSLI